MSLTETDLNYIATAPVEMLQETLAWVRQTRDDEEYERALASEILRRKADAQPTNAKAITEQP